MADTCDTGDQACVGGDFAQCVDGAWVAQACGSGETYAFTCAPQALHISHMFVFDTSCAALPLVNSKGTSITCDTQSDIDARIAATGATSSASSSTGAASTSAAGGSTAAASATTSVSFQHVYTIMFNIDVVCTVNCHQDRFFDCCCRLVYQH